MNLQVVIIAHGNGIAAFSRHEKFWLAHKAPILVCCPEDDPIESGHETIRSGLAQHSGPDSISRLRFLFGVLAEKKWDKCLIYEYDSFSLEPKIPDGNGLFGNVFNNAEAPKFMAPRYVNPPWCVDRGSFNLMNSKAIDYPSIYEVGESDRWVSALAFLSGVPILDYDPPGFSSGTIESKHFPNLEHAIKKLGAIHIHGVKQEWVLRAIQQFYQES